MRVHQPAPSASGPLAALGAQLAVVVAAVYGAFQLGQKLTTGEWLPANPFKWSALAPWEQWGPIHTAIAVALAIVVIGQIILAVRLYVWSVRKQEHIDAKARLLGRGRELTYKAVATKNASAKYTLGENIGYLIGRIVASRKEAWVDWRSTILAVMNPGAGKTTCIAIPWILQAPGWAYGTANKPDLYVAVRRACEKRGRFWCFDPQNVADVAPTWIWNPLSYIYGPGDECALDADSKATIQANLFADAARVMDSKTDGFFEPEGIKLLACLLLAAAVDKRQITAVVHWINNPAQGAEPVNILRMNGWELSASALEFAYALNPDTKRGVFANAIKVVNFLFNRESLNWITRSGPDDDRIEFDPHRFVRSERDTMISLSEEGTGSLGPLVAALTVAVVEAARSYAKTCRGQRLDPTGVLILDEAANVARIHKLPDWFSHFASQGIFIVVILQSLAQGRAAWGQDGIKKMSGASTHKLYGRGIDEIETLEAISKLCDVYDRRTYSTGNSNPAGVLGKGHASRSRNVQYVSTPVLNVAEIAAMPERRMITQYGGGKPVLIEMIPYYLDKEMDAAVKESIEMYGPKVLVTV